MTSTSLNQSGPGAEPPPPLRSRVAQSKLIFTGTVTRVGEDSIELRVDRCLKGSVEPSTRVVVSSDVPPAVGRLNAGDSGVWLVSAQGEPPELLGGGPVGVTESEVEAVLESG